MEDKKKSPPQGKKPSLTGKKLHLDLSEAMITDIDDDDDIIELKDEVTLSPEEKEPQIELPEIQLNDQLPRELSPESSTDSAAEQSLIDFEALGAEFAAPENSLRDGGVLSFEEEDEDDAETPSPAAEHPQKADSANEIMEITEFDDIVSEDDNEMISFLEDREESESEEEFLELIDVEEDSLKQATDEKTDEKIEEEIIQFDDPQGDVEDVELENFINESLNEEIQIGDELEDDLINSLEIEARPELNLTDKASETEEFNFNVDTSEISAKIDQLDTIFFDDTESETEYDDETAPDHEDRAAETENKAIRISDLDALEQPPPDVKPAGLGVKPQQIEQSIERFIEQTYSEKIESMITAIIEKAVAKEIKRLKNVLLEDNRPEDF